MWDIILQWGLPIIGSGGLGAAITYILTFKSKQKLSEAEAKSATIDATQKEVQLNQDNWSYMQKMIDKYMNEYHDLENEFRRQMRDLREQIDEITQEKSQIITQKCNEMATLRSQITYLKGLRCYSFTCQNRIKKNPDKEK